MEYALSYILPLLVLSGAFAGGFAAHTGYLFIFVLLPIMEFVADKTLTDARTRKEVGENLLCDYVLYGYVVLQTIALTAFLYQLAHGYLTVREQFALTFS